MGTFSNVWMDKCGVHFQLCGGTYVRDIFNSVAGQMLGRFRGMSGELIYCLSYFVSFQISTHSIYHPSSFKVILKVHLYEHFKVVKDMQDSRIKTF